MIAAARAIRTAILAPTEEARTIALKDLDQRLENTKTSLEKSEKMFVSADGRAKLAETRSTVQAYSTSLKEVVTLLRAEPLGEARGSVAKLDEARPLTEKAEDLMSKLVEQKQANADRLNTETDVIYAHIRVLLISLTMGGVLVGVIIGVVISRSLTGQLGGEPSYAAHIAGRIAEGDLTVAVETKAGDHSSLLFAMKTMRDSLANIVGQVRSGTDTIATR